MKSWQIELSRLLHISLDLLLLYIVVLPYFLLYSQAPPILTYSTMFILGMVIYEPGIRKYKNSKLGLLLVPITTAIGVVLFNLDLVISLLISIVLFWRLVYHHKEINIVYENIKKWGKEYRSDQNTIELNLFFITFLVGMIFYLVFYSLEEREIFLYLVFLQFFLVMLLKILNTSLNQGGSSPYKIQQLKWRFGKVALLWLVATSSFLLFKYFYFLVFFIIKLIISLISLLGYSLLYLLSLVNLAPPPKESTEIILAEIGRGPFEKIVLVAPTQSSTTTLLIIAATVLIAVVLFLIFWITGKFQPRQEDNEMEEYESLEADLFVKQRWSWQVNKPKQEVRKLFYGLELALAKRGKGRKKHETVEDWLHALKADSYLKEIIENTYHKVRYGEVEVSKAEISHYRKAIKELKKINTNSKKL
ncbi:MAG: hypothetical protein ACK4M9_18900 [Anaerobacillus sp.]|uniref:hypothetical protein n=1 Tax=Anaerobacillus sp. TaxID=1872506 RepID=UPI00391DD536